ncbi:MAG: aminoglycoside phosphotransferase [Lysobacterales bacterium]|nr:MAG: aminoglycoside phosphotransferase [Xanthomonadales bacterium]
MTTPAGRRAAAGTSLFTALTRPECYPHAVAEVRVIETHISWVMLASPYAYKIKKPVNLGFADFTTLALRRHYCEEEIRLNRRLAPGLYLDVVEIRGSAQAPRIDGEGPLIDYAVRMREFPPEALASQALKRGAFGATEIDALATTIAGFHAPSATAAEGDRFGAPETVLASALQNFEQMVPLARSARDCRALRALQLWTEHEFKLQREAFSIRKSGHFVRECHGDLHLGNIAVLDGKPVPFDCIEFNEDLRWIDVMSEVAFLVMDLEDRNRGDLAWRFLNRYLETTGDYAGLRVLRFYLVYRALVRAKIHLLRSRQPRLRRNEKSRLAHAFSTYLRLAERYVAPGKAGLIITHGLSGCGKTTATQPLLELLGAIRLRSDLERKRTHNLSPLASSGAEPGTGIYSREASDALYRRLGEMAGEVLRAGYSVVVDATFLRRAERDAFRAIAEQLDAPFLILNIHAPLEMLRTRITERKARKDDASEADLAVLKLQIAALEPLTPAEASSAVEVDGTRPPSREMLQSAVERLNPSRIQSGKRRSLTGHG